MFADFPNLHPLVVHFPIVLILLGAGLQVLLVFKDWQQMRWGALVIMGGGFAGALAASTIFHAMPEGLPPQALAVFNEHEKYSAYTLWLSGITFLLRGVGESFKIYRRSYEILVLVFALAAALFLSLAGHRGAQLVYVEGVGPKGALLMKGAHHHGGAMPTMNEGAGHGSQEGHPMGPASGPALSPPDKTQGPGLPAGHAPEGRATGEPQKDPGAERMAGHDMSTMPGTGPPRSMRGMDHANMPGMPRPPADAGNRTDPSPRPAMNHSKMAPSATPKSTGMDHGTMPMPVQPQGRGNVPPMEHGDMPGMNPGKEAVDPMTPGTKTDLNGRPLIDARPPYDNNPAREQRKAGKKQ